MSDTPLRRLLGTGDPDAGCEHGFEQLDQYCDAALRGDDVSVRFADIVAHIGNCAACREDTEGLIAALRQIQGE
jgi:hypothetical protein